MVGMAVYMADSLLDLNLRWKLYRVRLWAFGSPMAALSVPDDRYGWRLEPNASATISNPDFSVTHTTNARGHRVVPGRPDEGPVVTIMGGSFTMGTGVEDHESYPAVLQQEYWPHCRVRNLACEGYGTAHAVLLLREILEEAPRPDLVIYAWIHHHLSRNDRRESWLEMLDRFGAESPYFALNDGDLLYQGTIDADQALDDDDPNLVTREFRKTRAMLEEMRDLCRAREIPLVVVLLPWGRTRQVIVVNDRIVGFCRNLGIRHVNLSREAALADPDLYYPNDNHPMPQWHRLAARCIAARVKPKRLIDGP